MEFASLREDVPRLENAFECRIVCAECMKEELRKMGLLDCSPVCVSCMEEVLLTM